MISARDLSLIYATDSVEEVIAHTREGNRGVRIEAGPAAPSALAGQCRLEAVMS